jgi:hypothetical protein
MGRVATVTRTGPPGHLGIVSRGAPARRLPLTAPGRVRAGDAIALIAVLVTVLALPVLAIVITLRQRVPTQT